MASVPIVGGASEQRRDDRQKVFRTASLEVGRLSARCHILNLSTSGAMIDCAADLRDVMKVHLTADQFDQLAIVSWRIGSRAGLRFARPLTMSQVRRCF